MNENATPKKQWWKRWQIWAIIAAIVLVAAIFGGGETTATNPPQTNETSEHALDKEIASDAEYACLDAFKGAYSRGLAVTERAKIDTLTGRDLYPDETDEAWKATGEDPDAPLILVELTGQRSGDGATETIKCWTWPDGSAVANSETVEE